MTRLGDCPTCGVGLPNHAVGCPVDAQEDELPQTPAALAAWVDEKLMRLADLQAQERDIREVEDRRTADIAKWAADEVAKVERQASFFQAQLLQVARSFPYAGKAKSINLPYGSIGTRLQPLSVEIRDAERALAFAETNKLTVKTTVSTTDPNVAVALRQVAMAFKEGADLTVEPRKESLLFYARLQRHDKPDWQPHALDDGWTLNGGGDEPFVKPKREGT